MLFQSEVNAEICAAKAKGYDPAFLCPQTLGTSFIPLAAQS